MHIDTQRLCAWCGPVVIIICTLGLWVFGGFVPPPAPSLSVADNAATLREHPDLVRFGLLLMVFGAAFLAPWISVITVQMRRVEGRHSPLAYAQLILGTCLILEFVFPMMAIQAATYREDRDADLVRAMTDWGWMTFYGVTCTAVLQALVIGWVILADRREQPVFPRWSGYFNVWAALLFTPGTVLVFFKTGPFAWNGLFVFWLPFAVFFTWMLVMTRLLLVAAARQEQEESPAEPGAADVQEELARQAARLAELTEQVRRLEATPTPPR
jgi:hypothetical protein